MLIVNVLLKKGTLALCLLFAVACIYFFNSNEGAKTKSYWLWKESDLRFVSAADQLYLYQGDYLLEGNSRDFVKRGVSPSVRFKPHNPVLLVRLYRIDDVERLAFHLGYLLSEWKLKGVEIKEVQLDYDCASAHLANYSSFLKKLAATLNNNRQGGAVKLSVTGLVTWLTDNPDGLADVSGNVSYIHFQLYNNFLPLPNIANYLHHIGNYKHPYKLGITMAEPFQTLELSLNEYYQGTTIFLNR